jgi:hypothetical protein
LGPWAAAAVGQAASIISASSKHHLWLLAVGCWLLLAAGCWLLGGG